MLRDIIKKEIQETITSPKFVFTFLLCVVLILISVYTGIATFRAEQSEYSAALALNKKNLESVTGYGPLSVVGLKINRPPQVLGAIVNGVSEAVGRVATVNYTVDPDLVDSKYGSDPVFSIFETLDLTFIVKIVLGLFAILFTYDAIVGEKERGTLKLIISHGVPRDRLLMGKVIGGYISLLIALVIPFVLGLLILIIYPNIPLSGQDWARISLMFMIFFLYLSVFFTLGLFVSARSRKSSTSFLILLLIWVTFVTLIPKISVLAAARLDPIPSIHEITDKKEAFLRQAEEEHVRRNIEWNQAHPSATILKKKYQEEFRKHGEENSQRTTSRINAFNASMDRDYERRKRSQERLAIKLSRISPAAALMFSEMSLARTGMDEYERFLAAIRTYKAVFANWINAQSAKNFKFDRAWGDFAKVALAEMPQFKFEPESLSQSLSRALPDIGLMLVLITVFFAGAYFSFLKYDVR